jgi:hypothetical protein
MIDEPIIITGGSISITFNKDAYAGANGNYSHGDRRIVSIDVVDDNTSELMQTVQAPENGKCTITIHTE